MPSEVGAALLGPGLLGSELAASMEASDSLDLRIVAGRAGDGDGLAAAAAMGVETSEDGIDAILGRTDVEIVFDATTEAAQTRHAGRLQEAGKILVDLTPSCAEQVVVPVLNLDSALGRGGFHLVSGAAQIAVPIVHALDRAVGVGEAEIVATIAGSSAGPGTRQNIDGLTAGTATAACAVGGADSAQALFFFGPGGRDRAATTTIFARVREADESRVLAASAAACERLRAEVAGVELAECRCDGDVVVVRVELKAAGEGAVSPSLAPIVAAATRVGESLSRRLSGAGA